MQVKVDRDMEIDISDQEIILNKELNDLDNLALDFIKILDGKAVKYVLVSGYIAILFGRSRSSEDIDMFMMVSAGMLVLSSIAVAAIGLAFVITIVNHYLSRKI